MAELLNLQGKCQPLRAKPAHFVSHLLAAAQQGGLPPKIQALLQGWQPPQPDL